MHRTTIALAGAIIMSAALLSAQTKTSATKYRGCLVPGSSQGNYLLNNAVASDDKAKTKMSLKVVPESAKVNVEAQVTHEVEITGTVTPGAQGQPGTLTATKISWKADYCG
jgi:hypothetical protein